MMITISQFLRQYDSALEWLHRHGVRFNGTRLAAYRRIIARAEDNEARGRMDHQQRPELLNALIEASEIIEISQIEEDFLGVAGVLNKLMRISGGPEAMAPEGFDRARDYAFEFHTASVLQRQGEFGGFSLLDGDLTVGPNRYPAECKRVSSLCSLRNRLRGGKDKLNRLMIEGSPPGVIVVDLTRPIKIEHGQIFAESDEKFTREAEQRLLAYLALHVMTDQNIETLACPSVLGVMARCLSAGIAGDQANVRKSVVWHACSVHADGSLEDGRFREIARAFGAAELREGRLIEIVDAVENIQVAPRRGR